ncbi:MAG: N-acetylneuraminate synthase family protein [Rhodospirillales bacterium]|nr:N-acetylneuraminate synthase family protein [Rhodospirillales bacterium]
MSVSLGSRVVGDGQPCFITYEAGPTHSGLESAKRLVKLAADAGADAVKFQIIDPDRLVADRKLPFTYDVLLDRASERTETVSEPLYDILCRRALDKDEWRKLKAFSDGLGLAFFATIGFDDEIRLLEEIGCHSIKIASADVNHLPLIRKAARTGMCIQLDTGNASLGEIEVAVDAVRSEGNESIVIHQCPSGYPAKRDGINLNIIRTLKQMFGLPVAYSDHTPGWEMDVAAIALGANMVEKTITEDRTTRSVEHIFSLEPADMARFVRVVRDVEAAMGTSRRILAPEERRKRDNYRRSIFLAAPVAAGTKLSDAKIEFRRPGHGYGPDRYDELSPRIFRRDLPAGHMVAPDDLS